MAPAERQYDVVIFGATGFTGRRVAQEVVRSGFSGSWALAARDRSRLEALAGTLGVTAAAPGAPGLLLADVNDAASLAAMARAARVLINTVGPFRSFGEGVVRACVAAGTDYLDVSGEPEFIERMELKYSAAARAAGCYIASAVGFDSVPGDVGAWFTARQFAPPARCTLVETFISIRAGRGGFRGHFPTYESAVYGVASAGELSALRRRAAAERGRVDLKVPGPKPPRKLAPQWDSRVNSYVLPFMGSDASVVRRTAAAAATAGEPAYNCAVYLTISSRSYLALFLIFASIFGWLAQRGWGRRLLLAYPRLFSFGVFSHEGPTEAQMAATSFTMTNIGSGYSRGAPPTPEAKPDVTVTTRVAGPEPGYIACSIFVVAAAATLLEERARLGIDPGVHTPAWLLHNTSYMERLRRRGIAIERVSTVSAR